MRKFFDKFAQWLVGFGIEPFLHIVCTIAIAMVIARACFLTGADRMLAGYLAAFVTFVLGFIKESWDNKTEGVFEAKDIAANAIGALLFFLCWI
ncbi:MAG: hypothetical protein IKH15_11795 [Bacteroidales bacterium]|nr:hypothetical protein [Bacteroidales bacterium]